MPERSIVVYGELLGSGVAVRLASERPVGALVLDAPYTSLPDVGKLLYPLMPAQTFMVDRFEFEEIHRGGACADPRDTWHQ